MKDKSESVLDEWEINYLKGMGLVETQYRWVETLINRKVAETLDRVEAELPKEKYARYDGDENDDRIPAHNECLAEVKKAISKIRGDK